MDRPGNDYAAAAMAFAQQQQQASKIQPQQQQLGFHHNHIHNHNHPHPYQQQQQQHQFPPHPFIPLYPSPLQMYPFNPHIPPPHHPPPIHLLHPHPLLHHPPPPPPTPGPPPLPHFWGPYDSAPPPAPPPPDPDLHKRIDKLVEYAAKNGPEFESMIREKQRDNPAYSFLFGGEASGFYYYKLWLATRGAGGCAGGGAGAVGCPHPPPPPPPPPPALFISPAAGAGFGCSAGVVGAGQLAVCPVTATAPYMAPLHEQQQQGQTLFDNTKFFKGLSGPLPCDVALELSNVLSNLTGTKESIKGAKMWFMQRSPFAPALAEALRDRFFALEESERQLHIIYLANDILFDSLQRRANTQSLDNEALAFRPVLGPMLSRIYHNHQNREENQTRLQKILQFWGSKEVYDHATISELESEMMRAPLPDPLFGPSADPASASADLPTPSGLPQHQIMSNGAATAASLNPEKREGFIITTEDPQDNHHTQFIRNLPEHSGNFHIPPAGALLPSSLGPLEKAPPYPLFPPGLIPGMVRKMQIGSGVPYSPMSPLDIPTTIPPSSVSPSRVLDRVSSFFREVGEPNPSEGPMGPADGAGQDELGFGPAHTRKGGTCIPPPPTLAVETEALAAATVYAEPESPYPDPAKSSLLPGPTQYDDVYTSYRKQRSTTYHSSLGAAAARATV